MDERKESARRPTSNMRAIGQALWLWLSRGTDMSSPRAPVCQSNKRYKYICVPVGLFSPVPRKYTFTDMSSPQARALKPAVADGTSAGDGEGRVRMNSKATYGAAGFGDRCVYSYIFILFLYVYFVQVYIYIYMCVHIFLYMHMYMSFTIHMR